MTRVIDLPVDQIVQDPDTQVRVTAINWITVNEYAEDAKQGDTFPPVIVFFDGERYWLADGNHRLAMARLLERPTISADVREGGKRDAVLYAVGANNNHGLKRTNADKRAAVMKLLNDEEWAKWSDNAIAKACKVDHKTVSAMRPKTSLGNSQVTDRQYTNKHGTVTTMNTAAIGKPAEPEPPKPTLFEEQTKPEPPATQLPYTGGAVVPTVNYTPQQVASPGAQEPFTPSTALPDWAVGYDTDTTPDAEEEEQAEPETPTEPEVEQPAEPVAEQPTYTTTIINEDSQGLAALITEPIHLVITSPPYNVGIDYEGSSDDLLTYIPLITAVWKQCYKVMADGGRIAVVVPFGVGRNPYVPFDSQIIQTLIEAGFEIRGRIIWDKNTTGNRTSWGSFRLPSDPSLRDTTECIIVAHKGQSKLEIPSEVKRRDDKGTYTEWLADVDYFMELAQDHWVIAPESAQRIGHPAPFPVELAERLIRFYAYPGANILDPFAGSGTVGVAAQKLGCNATLVEISQHYCELARGRLFQ